MAKKDRELRDIFEIRVRHEIRRLVQQYRLLLDRAEYQTLLPAQTLNAIERANR